MAVLVVAGPTGVGKSAFALAVAQKYKAVVLCADAMTVYKGLDVGTAKPDREEQQLAPHFGLDLCRIDEEFSVADFVSLFDSVVSEHERVVLVGGTHFYLNALVSPLASMPQAQPEIRAQLEMKDGGVLYEKLQQVDPVIAEKLHPNDKRRVIRALEVFEASGIPLSEHQKKEPPRKALVAPCVWLERDDMRERIMLRLEKMVELGYWEECSRILDEGWSLASKPLLSFSYRYMLPCLQQNGSKEEAIEKTGFGTWKLVRKQRTWSNGLGWEKVHPDNAWDWLNRNNPFEK